ncbi:MAG: autotransporter outer membrane beta-barrel domain-containing protein, partial [Halothiobacillus sp.]
APAPAPTSNPGLAYTTAHAVLQQAWITQNSLFGMQDVLADDHPSAWWIDTARAQGGANASDVSQQSIVVGGQFAARSNWNVGAAFAVGRNHTQDAAQQVNGGNLGLFGYGAYRMGSWRFDAQIGAGRLTQDSTRDLNPTGLIAKGSTQGRYAAAGVKLRYHQSLGNSTFAEPYATAAYVYTHTNAFAEQGAGLLNLDYAAQDIHLGRISAGVKTGMNLDAGNGLRIQPWVKVGAAAYVGDKTNQQNLTLGVLTQPMTGRVAPNATLETGAGIQLVSADGHLSSSLSYSGAFSSEGHLNGVHLNLRYQW